MFFSEMFVIVMLSFGFGGYNKKTKRMSMRMNKKVNMERIIFCIECGLE